MFIDYNLKINLNKLENYYLNYIIIMKLFNIVLFVFMVIVVIFGIVYL